MVESHLDFLRLHQPLPLEAELSAEQIDRFEEVRQFFVENHDDRCIPLLINAVNADGGFGVYQMVEDALQNQTRSVVVSELELALCQGKDHHLAWVLEWATSFESFELEERIQKYVDHPSADISTNAKLYLNSKSEALGKELPFSNLFEEE
jgi:hypothetical protein